MLNATDFTKKLQSFSGETTKENVLRFFNGNDGQTDSLGVQFGTVFKLAKEFIAMPLSEISQLLDSPYYEVRMGAVSIMDYQAKAPLRQEAQGKKKKTPFDISTSSMLRARKKELFDLYLHRHDRLNNWDFVDRAAPSVIGDYLVDKERNILYELAVSDDIWKRRTAIVSTYAFIRKNDLDDTFKIAEILIHDKEELINKAVGSWIRTAGAKDLDRLKKFLDKYAATMPRVMLRYAVEKLDKGTKDYYMKLK